MNYAIIDIGSNSMQLSIYKVEGENFHQLTGKKSMAGLISYHKNGKFSKRGIQKLLSVLREFQDIIDNLEIANCSVFATAALRNISNEEAVLDAVKTELGIKVNIVSGEEEARLDFLGVMSIFDISNGIVLDIGGGSTELVRFEGREISHAESVPLGSLNSFDEQVSKLLPKRKEMEEITKSAKKALGKCVEDSKESTQYIVGVGGSIRATQKVINEYCKLPKNENIQMECVDEFLEFVAEEPHRAMRFILKIVPERVHTLVPGMLIMRYVASERELDELLVSKYGVREGYLIQEMMTRKNA